MKNLEMYAVCHFEMNILDKLDENWQEKIKILYLNKCIVVIFIIYRAYLSTYFQEFLAHM